MVEEAGLEFLVTHEQQISSTEILMDFCT